MPNHVREELAERGPVGEAGVIRARGQASDQVAATVVNSTDQEALYGFVKNKANSEATVCSDNATTYASLPCRNETVKHSLQEYYRGDLHSDLVGFHRFNSMRAYKDTFRKLSPQHPDRYGREFAVRHNPRELDTIDINGTIVLSMDRKQPKYGDLTKHDNFESGARTVIA